MLIKSSVIFTRTYVIFFLLCTALTHAQLEPGKYISVNVGLGLSAPDDDSEAGGTGFYAHGEYLVSVYKWFSIRPYVGLVNTNPLNPDRALDQLGYEVTTKALFFGSKIRLAAPIPYVAPFIETGMGLSVGAFKTYTEYTDINKKGVFTHIPFSMGLALGKHNNFELGFTYQFHQTVKQSSGTIALGYNFALD
ncbi:hypothetical protein KIH23_12135 [Flavobacterium sp. CYK-55]|uniref:hypothetical protein n=1 Tax=Flavobacterium sp. CYK-55 TaxID=2835529 RepID=UPI001BCDF75C|nr:hypothetical protein [Flavobacterium sp. CYK-55]MBS7788047.1 hypothetical protein [Flavobacterium sp. CYK-55]